MWGQAQASRINEAFARPFERTFGGNNHEQHSEDSDRGGRLAGGTDG